LITDLPNVVVDLAARCADAGGRAYLVGGGVRDHLMGRAVHDWDIEVFGLPATSLVGLLKRLGTVNAVGRSFGVYKLRPHGWARDRAEVDVSIPRRDSKVGPGHRGISVEGDPHMSLVEATRRRDLTVNAILYDVLNRSFEDPWNGRADIRQKRLCAVDRETFLEDPLRALRVIQFAARLEFSVDSVLMDICKEANLHELPSERVQGEWAKLMMSIRPSIGMDVAREARVLARVFPEVARCEQGAALDRLAKHQRDSLPTVGQRWCVMLATWLKGASEPDVVATLDRLTLHRCRGYPLREKLLQVMRYADLPTDSDGGLRNLAARAEVGVVLRSRWALTEDTTCLDTLARARLLGLEFTQPPALLRGRDLKEIGMAPGPAIGTVLKAVYQLQLDGHVTTHQDALDAALRLSESPS
jgi:tRNA nucleotidyltransferase (CCA-adding enzyme)